MGGDQSVIVDDKVPYNMATSGIAADHFLQKSHQTGISSSPKSGLLFVPLYVRRTRPAGLFVGSRTDSLADLARTRRPLNNIMETESE